MKFLIIQSGPPFSPLLGPYIFCALRITPEVRTTESFVLLMVGN